MHTRIEIAKSKKAMSKKLTFNAESHRTKKKKKKITRPLEREREREIKINGNFCKKFYMFNKTKL